VEQLALWTDPCTNTSVVPLTGYTCTASCAGLQYADANGYCVSCTLQTGHCVTCDATSCLSCDATAFRVLSSPPVTCVCAPTYFDLNGTCTLCSAYLTHCVSCSSQTTCTACDIGFTPSSGVCVCSPGTYLHANSTCIALMGCITPNNITNALYCLQCDTANYFLLLANQTCICMANTVYDPVTGICVGICSDGASLGNDCDLGALNGVAGSGCASNCTVVPGYYCSNPSTTQASVCVLKATYSASFMYVTKDLTSNTAKIYLELSPKDSVLANMDFSSLVTTSFPTSKISCTYNPTTGVLLVLATYTESIEGTKQLITVGFNETQIYAPKVNIYADMNGVNARLDFGTFESYNNIVLYMSMFVGGAGLVFAVVAGLVGFKMIGFEICLPVQVTYLSLCLLNVPYSALSSTYGLGFSTGYNQLSSFDLLSHLNLDKGLIVLQRTNFFIENCNFTYILLAVLLVAAVVARGFVGESEEAPKKMGAEQLLLKKKKGEDEKKGDEEKEKEKEKVEEVKQPKEESRGEKVYNFLIDRMLVNVWVLLLLLAFFAFGIQLQGSESSGSYSLNLNIAVGLLVTIAELGGLVFIVLKLQQKDRSVTFRSYSRYYPVFYIIAQLSAVLIIVTTYYLTTFALFIAVIPQVVVIFLYVKLDPHGKFKSFVGIAGFYCQCIPVISSALFIVCRYIGMTMFSTVSAFMILGLYLIG
jgi:hypothetical protein